MDESSTLLFGQWFPMESAPTDGTTILVWCAPAHGLSALYSTCAYHPDAGFCVDALRPPTRWTPLPDPPNTTGEAALPARKDA
jgi:hypothetical protein